MRLTTVNPGLLLTIENCVFLLYGFQGMLMCWEATKTITYALKIKLHKYLHIEIASYKSLQLPTLDKLPICRIIKTFAHCYLEVYLTPINWQVYCCNFQVKYERMHKTDLESTKLHTLQRTSLDLESYVQLILKSYTDHYYTYLTGTRKDHLCCSYLQVSSVGTVYNRTKNTFACKSFMPPIVAKYLKSQYLQQL